MSSTRRPLAPPAARLAATTALLGAVLLAGLPSVLAARPQLAQATTTKSQAAKDATGVRPETVEQRIANLHATLKITPAEEAQWDSVARVMRDNAATVEKLVAAKKLTQGTEGMTALDDLMTYQAFAEAHVEGLKNLIAAFKALYDAMPADQKKVVDESFQNYGSNG